MISNLSKSFSGETSMKALSCYVWPNRQDAEQIIQVLSLFTMKARRKAMEEPFEQPGRMDRIEPQAMRDRDYYHTLQDQHLCLLEHHHLLVSHQRLLLMHSVFVQDCYCAAQNHSLNRVERTQAMQALHEALQEHHALLQEHFRLLQEHNRLR